MTELIVYATPTGALAERSRAFWDAMVAGRPTEAQRFPPHCTVTGFFHRPASRLETVLTDLQRAVALATGEPSVEVLGVRSSPDWIGLELASPWLIELATRFRDVHAPRAGDDAVRPKNLPHLSLAYGDGFDPSLHQPLVQHHFGDIPAGGWDLGLWERTTAGGWHAHGRRTIVPPTPPTPRPV